MDKKILNKLKELKPVLNEKYGIEEFAVFGSVARGDNHQDSDIDIVIMKVKKRDYFLRLKAIEFLKNILKKDVDMGYYNSMRPVIQELIKEDLVYV